MKLESTPTLRWLLGAFLLLLLVGCGKKGPPIPYDVTVPTPIVDLESAIRSGRVFLRWSMPRRAPDESEMAEVSEFRILRQETPLDGEWCEECPARLEPLEVLRMDQRDNFSVAEGRVVYEDKRISHGHVYVYRVISVSARGYASELSNRAVVEWGVPPGAPSRVEGTGGDRTVNLRWNRVEETDGYRIYRKQQGSEFGDVPVAVVGPNQFSYCDTGLSNDLVYQYTVRSLRKVGRTVLEGPGSEEISMIPRDVMPPLPPERLLAIPLDLGIELSWQRNTEPDLLGYFVYRRDRGEGEYRRLNEFPLQAPVYVDRTVIVEQSYEYRVTAVDRSPQRNESGFSEAVRLVHVR